MSKKTFFIYFITLLSSTILLSACATINFSAPPQTQYQKQTWQERYRALSKVTKWHMEGAFSLQQPQHSAIANYSWDQNKQNYTIHIYSSLHFYETNIIGTTRQITLLDSDNKRYTAKTPEILLQQHLGWHLPISNLFYWIRGLPGKGPYHLQNDVYGHLTQLQQDGWVVQFSRYKSVDQVDLPQLLQLKKGSLNVRIAVKNVLIPS